VILLDRYDSGWRAWVDGHPAPVLRADLVFRAVQVSSGEHLVRFEYHQIGLRSGLAITLGAFALLLGLYIADRVKLIPLISD
ncbi:MAG: YfhO family protein, partial [Terriglobia bacterium]